MFSHDRHLKSPSAQGGGEYLCSLHTSLDLTSLLGAVRRCSTCADRLGQLRATPGETVSPVSATYRSLLRKLMSYCYMA